MIQRQFAMHLRRSSSGPKSILFALEKFFTLDSLCLYLLIRVIFLTSLFLHNIVSVRLMI